MTGASGYGWIIHCIDQTGNPQVLFVSLTQASRIVRAKIS